ncbi:uncharacterized protein LOC127833496 isoform X4 [Dreissena polymorpha]|nr:uncharacterized protein LOC127833496 isoform X4 [Dreissena polymorpha]
MHVPANLSDLQWHQRLPRWVGRVQLPHKATCDMSYMPDNNALPYNNPYDHPYNNPYDHPNNNPYDNPYDNPLDNPYDNQCNNVGHEWLNGNLFSLEQLRKPIK